MKLTPVFSSAISLGLTALHPSTLCNSSPYMTEGSNKKQFLLLQRWVGFPGDQKYWAVSAEDAAVPKPDVSEECMNPAPLMVSRMLSDKKDGIIALNISYFFIVIYHTLHHTHI